MGSYRWVFNWAVSQKEKEYGDTGSSSSYMKGRKEWISRVREEAPWISETPAHTVYGAMMDADKAYKAAVVKRTKGLVSELPRCRKRTQRSFYILGNAITPKGIYPRLLGELRAAEPLPNKPSDSRILYECGRWYLLTPEPVQTRISENQGRVCSIDPGVRTFATVFSMEGIHKLGDGAFGRIHRLCSRLDDLLSRAYGEKSRRKRRMLKAAARARRKIRRLVDDMHYQALGFIFRNFDTLVLPECNFQSAVAKKSRKLRTKTARSLLTWAFARFRNRAVHVAQKTGKGIVIVNEAYTSKTANWTGEIVHNLGGRRSIVSRGVRVDRDVNAALGILLKALVDHPEFYSANVNQA